MQCARCERPLVDGDHVIEFPDKVWCASCAVEAATADPPPLTIPEMQKAYEKALKFVTPERQVALMRDLFESARKQDEYFESPVYRLFVDQLGKILAINGWPHGR